MNLDARADRRLVRSRARSDRYILVDITAPEGLREPVREPLNVAFVLDRSGSMAGAKISLARSAIDAAIGALEGRDRFAVVAYDDRIDVAAPSAPATGANRAAARRSLDAIDARGSTNLFEGWMRGCAEVAERQADAGMHRVLLMSDGLANIGVTDPEELARHAAELRVRGVATWTFGFGHDFDEALLERLAVAGGGQSFYVETPQQIRDYVTNAVGEALDVVARDAQLLVEVPEGVLVEPLGLFRSHRRGGVTVVELGDLVSSQQLRLVLKVNLPQGRDEDTVVVRLSLSDRDGALSASPREVEWAYADHRANDLQPRDREVDREVAGLHAARVRKEAALRNREGDYAGASRALAGAARRIRGYAGSDPQLLHLADELEQAELVVSAPMAAPAIKRMHAASSYVQRGRDPLGRARKAPDRTATS